VDALINHRRHEAILDSGAGHSAINKSVAQSHRLPIHKWQWGKIRLADGRTTSPCGFAFVQVQIGPSTACLPCAVLESLPVPILLGFDYLVKARAISLWDEATLVFKGKVGTVPLHLESALCEGPVATVLEAAENNSIPALSERLIKVRIPHDNLLASCEETTLDIMSLPRRADEWKILAANGLAPVRNAHTYIMVANLSNLPREIRQGQVIAAGVNHGDKATADMLLHSRPSSPKTSGTATPAAPAESAGEPSKPAPTIEEMTDQVHQLMIDMRVDERDYTLLQVHTLIRLVFKHRDAFSKEPGLTHLVEHHIDVAGHPPMALAPRRKPLAMRSIVKEHITEMLAKGLIRPSSSAWAAPIVLVPKKETGKWRMTVDYRHLNEVVPRDAFPLPRIDDSLALLGNAEWFTTFDLVSGYWQIAMAPGSIDKTAFVCSEGLFEYLRLPMGLANSPATFQRLMQLIIPAGVRASHALVYFNDIIVFLKTFEEHLDHLDDILTRVGASGLKIRPDKTSLARRSVHYLGHVVDSSGTRPDPQRCAAINKMPVPADISQLRSFLRLTSYYRCYVRRYANMAAPLTALLKKDVPFVMGPAQLKAIDQLKQALQTEPVLRRPNFDLPFILQTNALGYRLLAVLSQRDETKPKGQREWVVGFALRSLSQPE
jgi:hypothetical protein